MHILTWLEYCTSIRDDDICFIFKSSCIADAFFSLLICFKTAIGQPRDLIQNDNVTVIPFVYIHKTSLVGNGTCTLNIFYVTACQHL